MDIYIGQVVAMRDSATNAVTYLHGDHLGSVSLATDSSGAVVSRQDFDPWGKARGTSTIPQTSLNYTGQRLDGTGLLYYHARYYDPALARFVSADSVVPGSASGGMDGVALKGLTVDFHETGFVGQLAGENGQPFWFQMSGEQQQEAGSPWGPANPQALNRYSYVLNRPLRYVDPTGHFAALIAGVLAGAGITISAPLIAAIAAVIGVAALAIFLSDENNRAWLSRQIENGITDASSFAQSLVGKIFDTSHRDKGGGWERRRTTDGRNVRVKRLSDQEVHDRGLHEEKQGQGYRGKPAIYKDEEGNTYVGDRGGGPIEPEF